MFVRPWVDVMKLLAFCNLLIYNNRLDWENLQGVKNMLTYWVVIVKLDLGKGGLMPEISIFWSMGESLPTYYAFVWWKVKECQNYDMEIKFTKIEN
jgi:hypothetical protein